MGMTNQEIVQKLWNECNVLRDDGVSYQDYITELTYILFLKMSKEQGQEDDIPEKYRWDSLVSKEGLELKNFYRQLLLDLGNPEIVKSPRINAIYANASTAIDEPANLEKIIKDIDELDWFSAREEGLGDLYEGLMEKNASEVKSGAGQYFTPRVLINMMVRMTQPKIGDRCNDPAAGTFGFMVAADQYLKDKTDDYSTLDEEQEEFQEKEAFSGMELVPNTHRLAMMNQYLHGMDGRLEQGDSLSANGKWMKNFDVVLTNPPFGTKKGGERATRDDLTYETSNKQLNFLQITLIHQILSNLLTNTISKQNIIRHNNCGVINPENIDEYIAMDGYEALGRVLTQMTPDEVIQTIKDSGLRGRGGGGFPTGQKWFFARQSKGDVKYVCCNADEGDPGAFMYRSVLEGDPHVVLEAMSIAGYAIGAHQGYIYVRAEYPIAIHRLQIAIKQAREYGFLGDDIFGTGFSFDIELRLGSGAFVCGEETALMTSIEGHRGEPRPRPPFPAVKGLFGVPTILNNVETWANIPRIILNGAEWFSSMGTERSKGTKVFCLVGKINNTGLVEIPMGTTLREIIEDIGGGIPNGKKFKAAQTGGPSGGCIPASLIDTPIDYDNLVAIGSMMGSGGLIVMDEDTCMVDIAKFFLEFTVDESCGKCTPCRIGTRRLLEMLEQITAGNGTPELLKEMEELCYYIKANSLCALGQSAPNPVLSTLHYFRDEYEAHCIDKRCPAGVCKRLTRFVIEENKCKGCTACARACPVNAISGEVRKPHAIDAKKCIKCGACMETCRFGAIVKR